MTTKKRPQPRKPSPATKARDWQYYAKLIAVAAVGLSGVIYIYNVTVPAIVLMSDSGPAPFAGRVEVEALREQGTARFEAVDQSIQITLDTAKAALNAADDAKQQSNDNRMRRLLEQQKEFQARLDAAPSDRLFRELLETNQAEIQKMLDEAKLK